MAGELYQAIGETAACRKLSAAFYARVARDPILRPLFPGKTLRCAIEEFSAFLVQFLGGPPEDTEKRWWLSLRESHLRFRIGQKERDAWMANMVRALDDVEAAEHVRSALLGLFEKSSAYVINTGHASPAEDRIASREIEERWDRQRALDQAVAAVRAGDTDRVTTLRTRFERNRALFAHLIGLMIASGHSAMEDYARKCLVDDPALARERYSGRTLLHAAGAAGNLTIVELLLRLGADPNTVDSGGHAPLYSVGNECASGGGSVVRALVASGADVNASGGVKRCTALHMAARRGNVEVAAALLACGADIEARDSLGDTPLRRALNCRKKDVAALLVSKGA